MRTAQPTRRRIEEMQALELRAAITGALLTLAAILGVLLSVSGRLLNPVLATVHKLAALAAVVFAVILTRDMLQTGGAIPLFIAVIFITGLLFVLLFLTGALLSVDRTPGTFLRAVHASLPFLAVSATLLLASIGLRKV
jgi:hypothetical protein